MKLSLTALTLALCTIPFGAALAADKPPTVDTTGINMPPPYPAHALKAGEKGSVIVKAFVRENGTVRNVNVISSGYDDLDSAAANAVLHWKFNPAMKDGAPASEWTAVRLVFDPAETSATPAPLPAAATPQP